MSDEKLIECLGYCGNKAEVSMCNLCIFRTNSNCRSLLLSTAAKRIKTLAEELKETNQDLRRARWGTRNDSGGW